MSDSIDGKLFSAVTEMRQFFSRDTDNDKFQVYANSDGELFIFLPYKEFMALIKKPHSEVG